MIYRAFERSGANMDMEFVLYRALQAAGLPTATATALRNFDVSIPT
jgi:hypothetical protein